MRKASKKGRTDGVDAQASGSQAGARSILEEEFQRQERSCMIIVWTAFIVT